MSNYGYFSPWLLPLQSSSSSISTWTTHPLMPFVFVPHIDQMCVSCSILTLGCVDWRGHWKMAVLACASRVRQRLEKPVLNAIMIIIYRCTYTPMHSQCCRWWRACEQGVWRECVRSCILLNRCAVKKHSMPQWLLLNCWLTLSDSWRKSCGRFTSFILTAISPSLINDTRATFGTSFFTASCLKKDDLTV